MIIFAMSCRSRQLMTFIIDKLCFHSNPRGRIPSPRGHRTLVTKSDCFHDEGSNPLEKFIQGRIAFTSRFIVGLSPLVDTIRSDWYRPRSDFLWHRQVHPAWLWLSDHRHGYRAKLYIFHGITARGTQWGLSASGTRRRFASQTRLGHQPL